MKILNGDLYGDFEITFKQYSYRFMKEIARTYSQTIARYCAKYPKMRSFPIQNVEHDENVVNKVISLLAGFNDIAFEKKELIPAFQLISELSKLFCNETLKEYNMLLTKK